MDKRNTKSMRNVEGEHVEVCWHPVETVVRKIVAWVATPAIGGLINAACGTCERRDVPCLWVQESSSDHQHIVACRECLNAAFERFSAGERD